MADSYKQMARVRLGMSLGFSSPLRMFHTRCVLRASLALMVVFLFARFAAAQNGQNLVLAWNPSPDPTVVGYVVYYGTSSTNFTTRIDVGTNTTYTVTGLQPGITYYFAVSDYNSLGIESEPSAPFAFLVPGIVKLELGQNGSMVLRFPVTPPYTYEVQVSTDLKKWVTLWKTGPVSDNVWMNFADTQAGMFPYRFYRVISN